MEYKKLDELSLFYKALSDYSRLKIILTLIKSSGLNVSEIVEKVQMSQTAVSNQLKTLKEVNLVKYERKGKNIIYSIDDKHVEDIINLTITHLEENDEY